MGRCGCAGSCSCVIEEVPGNPINVDGFGTPSNPWKITYTGAVSTCDDVSACVGGRLGGGLQYNATSKLVSVRYSTDSGNAAGPGSDGHLFVATSGTGAGGVVVWDNTGATVTLSGEGTPAQPLKANLLGGGRAYTKDSTDMNFSGSGQVNDGVTAVRKAIRLRAGTDAVQNLTTAWKKYPVESSPSGTYFSSSNGCGRASGGNIIVDIAGWYVVSVRTYMHLNNPATASAIGYVALRSAAGGGELWFSADGNGGNACIPAGTMVMYFPKGATLYAEVECAGTVSKPTVINMQIDLAYIGQ